jgi:SAM-dependent methyltransferase
VFDISEENKRYACETAAAADTHINYVVGDVMNIDMSVYGGYFDIVFMEGGILHYFYDINRFMGVMNNLLKDGGKMICSDFHPIHKLVDVLGLGGQTTDYTYMDLLHDLLMVFDMSQEDPWVAFYGEPEPEPDPIPEPKIQKPEPKQEVKQAAKKPEPVKDSKPAPKSEEKKPEKVKEEAPIPGQIEIEDYPGTVPEQLEEDEEEKASWQQDSEDHSEEPITNEPEEQFEVVEADIVHTQNEDPVYDINVKYDAETGEVEVLLGNSKVIKLIRVIDTGTGESWEVTINH